MPSMACLILRAVAQVSSSAALVAYRFAGLTRAAAAAAEARSGSGGAAVAAGPPRSRLSHDSGSTVPIINGEPIVRPACRNFEANEKDLESDGALWNLYERWCKVFKQERDPEEMARRFSYFKKTVLRVEENKKSDLPYSLEINMFADGKIRELQRYTMNRARKRSASPFYGSEVGFSSSTTTLPNKQGARPGGPATATETSNPSAIE